MDFGAVIKRAWQITWRYKALWVLGLFAGVSGWSGGGGGGGNSGSDFSGLSDSTSGSGSGFDTGDFSRFVDQLGDYLPLIIGFTVLLIFVGLLWSILGVAARGGLVTGVNAIEEGAARSTGELWRAGFSRFWSLVGLDILLKLPVVAVLLLMAVAIIAPIAGVIAAGGEPGPEVLVPICGSLVIGIPLSILGSLVLGMMHVLALRYVMLGGQGAVQAARNSWGFLRARLKDTVLMWLINGGLNLAAGFALAIPVIAVVLVFVLPLMTAGVAEAWGVLFGFAALLVVVMTVVSLLYNGIWGTFTSSLWTLFFRRAAGMHVEPELPVPVAPSEPVGAVGPEPQPPLGPPIAEIPEPPATPDA